MTITVPNNANVIIVMLLDMKDKDFMFPQLKDNKWKTDLAFLCDDVNI
jgi:hypothetical protein